MKLSSRYRLLIPKDVRTRMRLTPGTRITVLEKGGVILLVPERPVRAQRGIVRGARVTGLREKTDRL